jgi:hypothetical protein
MVPDRLSRAGFQLLLAPGRECRLVTVAFATKAALPVHDQLVSAAKAACVHPMTQQCLHYRWRQS